MAYWNKKSTMACRNINTNESKFKFIISIRDQECFVWLLSHVRCKRRKFHSQFSHSLQTYNYDQAFSIKRHWMTMPNLIHWNFYRITTRKALKLGFLFMFEIWFFGPLAVIHYSFLSFRIVWPNNILSTDKSIYCSWIINICVVQMLYFRIELKRKTKHLDHILIAGALVKQTQSSRTQILFKSTIYLYLLPRVRSIFTLKGH